MNGQVSKSVDFWAQSYSTTESLRFFYLKKIRLDLPFLHCLLSPLLLLLFCFSCIFWSLRVSASGAVLLLLLYPSFSTPSCFTLWKVSNPLNFFHCWKISSVKSPITYNSDTGKCVWTHYMWRWKGTLKIFRRCQEQEKPGEFESPFSVPSEKLPWVLPDLHRTQQMQ